jgi:hypothetical protein
MKKFLKQLGGICMLYVGTKLSRDAQDLDAKAAYFADQAQQRRQRSNVAMLLAAQLLEGYMKTYVIKMTFEDEELDDVEDEDDEDAEPNGRVH